MAFKLPDEPTDIGSALRAAEPQAPKDLKPLLILAAQRIEHYQSIAYDSVAALDEAAALRIGQHDSTSKAEQVTQSIKMAMKSVADRLRARA